MDMVAEQSSRLAPLVGQKKSLTSRLTRTTQKPLLTREWMGIAMSEPEKDVELDEDIDGDSFSDEENWEEEEEEL